MILWHTEKQQRQHTGKHSERKQAVANLLRVLGLSTLTRTAKELEQLNHESDNNESLQIELVS